MIKSHRRKCAICREWFIPRFQNERWCCPEHGAELGVRLNLKNREKAIKALENKRRQEQKKKKDKLKIRKLSVKPLSYFAKQAQTEFNAYIRERDSAEPCISCGRSHNGQYHAGHFRTVGGNPELRFDEDNCHKQCAPCNNHLSGNIAGYQPNLIVKIGTERFNRLMEAHEARHYTRKDFECIRDEYKEKRKALNQEAA